MFIKYSCGCLAIRDPDRDEVIVLQRCDRNHDDNDYTFSDQPGKDLKGRSFEKISHMDKSLLVAELRQLIYQGYKYRQIKSLLKD